MTGYKNPPKNSQFKKGVSGNPNGRPKGSKNKDSLVETLRKEFDSELQLADGSIITKKEAAVKNFTNNMVKTSKLHESARGLEVMLKMETEDKDNKTARQFLTKMLKDGFLNEDDIQDFINGRKDPKFNYPKSVNNLFNKEKIKDIAAWESVKQIICLSDLFRMIESIDSINILIKSIENNIYSNEKIIDYVLPILEDHSEIKSKVINILDNPEQKTENSYILRILYKMLFIEKNNLQFYIFYQRDFLKNQSYYKENEKAFFEDNIINATLDKSSQFTKDELEKAKIFTEETYEYFINKDNSYEYMDRKDFISDEERRDLASWLAK